MFLKMIYTVLVQKVPLSVLGIFVSINPAINQCWVGCNSTSLALWDRLLLSRWDRSGMLCLYNNNKICEAARWVDLGKKIPNNIKAPQTNRKTSPSIPPSRLSRSQSASEYPWKLSRVTLIQHTLCTHLEYNLQITSTRSYLGKTIHKIPTESV